VQAHRLTIHRVIKQRAGAPEIISAVDRLAWSLAESGRRILKQRVRDKQLIDKVGSLHRGARETLRDAFLLVKASRLGLAPELIHMTRRLPGLRERIASTIEEASSSGRRAIRVTEKDRLDRVGRRSSSNKVRSCRPSSWTYVGPWPPWRELGPRLREAGGNSRRGRANRGGKGGG